MMRWDMDMETETGRAVSMVFGESDNDTNETLVRA